MFEWIAYLTGKEPEQVCREWHSFWIGWAEMVCLSIPSRFPITVYAKKEMSKEYHYYNIGRGIGIITIVILIKAVFHGR